MCDVQSTASTTESSTTGASATVLVLRNAPAAVTVTNFFTGSLPLTGSEPSMVALWVGLAVLAMGLAIVVVAVVRRRRLE